MAYLEILAGLVVLVLGAELLVRSSVAIARRLGVSTLLIGLTLVGFGTSSPELVASITAGLKGSPGIAVGNVVGSNICNVFLILGFSALIAPLAITRKAFLRDGPVLVGASALLLLACLLGEVSRWFGVVLLALLMAYLVWCYRTEREDPQAAAIDEAAAAAIPAGAPVSMSVSGLGTAGGLLLLVAGAWLLVGGAITLARTLGISEALIGLTVVAVGTSLPELATSVVAAARRQADVAFGNIIGSNIYNILGILGVVAVIQPVAIPPEIVAFDIWVMLGSSALLVAFALTGWRIVRWEGAALLAAYGAYVAWLVRAAALSGAAA